MKTRDRGRKTIGVFYEHPEWFEPMFAEFDRRGVSYERLLAHEHHYDPAERVPPYALVLNRMSPSAHLRGGASSIRYTLDFLAHLERIGAPTLNGLRAYEYEFSKARQLGLLERLGLPYPRARVFNHPSQAAAAAEGLRFPVVVKPNIGGSGAGIVKFDSIDILREAAEAGAIDTGLDGTALVQEHLPARENRIVRVEVMNGSFLYAIRLELAPDTFNLCPADYCRVPEGEKSLLVEGYTPPAEIIEDVLHLTREAGIEVGGVEYLIDDRDGEPYYYDINALSNFVADAPNVVGFDPFPKLVDFVLERAGLREAVGV